MSSNFLKLALLQPRTRPPKFVTRALHVTITMPKAILAQRLTRLQAGAMELDASQELSSSETLTERWFRKVAG